VLKLTAKKMAQVCIFISEILLKYFLKYFWSKIDVSAACVSYEVRVVFQSQQSLWECYCSADSGGLRFSSQFILDKVFCSFFSQNAFLAQLTEQI